MASELNADIASMVPRRVWTVGHVHHTMELYLDLLAQHGIQVVCDVRSVPYSRHAPQFNREELESTLESSGVRYEYLGERLGGRPDGAEFYDDDGRTLYEPLVAQRWFLKDIGRIEHLAERDCVALTCVEEQPERCHRYYLLGKVLADRGAEVVHIRRDGGLTTQHDVAQMLGEGQESLFSDEPKVWRSPIPMRDGHGVIKEDEGFETY